MDSVPVKRCSRCGIEKLATTEFFYSRRGRPDGLQYVCIACHKLANHLKSDPSRRAEAAQNYYDAVAFGRAFKVCTSCKAKLPPTNEFFSPHSGLEKGLQPRCKACRNAEAKAWAEVNPGKIRIKSLTYRKENADKVRQTNRQQRALRAKAEGSFSLAEFEAKLKNCKGKCHWCGEKIKGTPHADHVMPLAKGGSNWINNIVPSCASCNNRKHAKMPWDFSGRLF